jgi:hypothetical protein
VFKPNRIQDFLFGVFCKITLFLETFEVKTELRAIQANLQILLCSTKFQEANCIIITFRAAVSSVINFQFQENKGEFLE